MKKTSFSHPNKLFVVSLLCLTFLLSPLVISPAQAQPQTPKKCCITDQNDVSPGNGDSVEHQAGRCHNGWSSDGVPDECDDPTTTDPGEACNPYQNRCERKLGTVPSSTLCAVDEPGVQTAIGCIRTNPDSFISQTVSIGVGIGSGLAFLSLLFGAFKLTRSQGDPEGVGAAKEIITSAVIGLVFIVMSVTIFQIIGIDILGLGAITK